MVKVLLSSSARAYLRKEAQYLRQRSRPAAEAFLARMREARINLQRFPQMGFQKAGLPIPGMRSLIVDAYIIDYEVSADTVLILAVRPSQIPEASLTVDDDFDYEDDVGD